MVKAVRQVEMLVGGRVSLAAALERENHIWSRIFWSPLFTITEEVPARASVRFLNKNLYLLMSLSSIGVPLSRSVAASVPRSTRAESPPGTLPLHHGFGSGHPRSGNPVLRRSRPSQRSPGSHGSVEHSRATSVARSGDASAPSTPHGSRGRTVVALPSAPGVATCLPGTRGLHTRAIWW